VVVKETRFGSESTFVRFGSIFSAPLDITNQENSSNHPTNIIIHEMNSSPPSNITLSNKTRKLPFVV